MSISSSLRQNLTKTFFLLIAFSFLHISANAQEHILGTWLTQAKDGKVEIYEQDGKYFGKIIWIDETSNPDGANAKDRNNPDPALRSRPVLNCNILQEFKYKGDDEWKGGTIYDPNNGKTYKSTIWFDEDKNVLNVRGYVAFFYRTEKWTRAK